MGILIPDNQYTQDELRRLALPGKAVTTLFWALPVGSWHQKELEEFWLLFTGRRPRGGITQETDSDAVCAQLGCLLLRDSREPRVDGATDIASHLEGAVGGDLFDLIPQARLERYPDREAAILLLSGAYPQPGWGVLVPVRRHRRFSAEAFPDAIASAVMKSCEGNLGELGSIPYAAHAYDERRRCKAQKPDKPDVDFTKMTSVIASIRDLLSLARSETAADLLGPCDRAKDAITNYFDDPGFYLPDEDYQDLKDRVKIVRALIANLAREEGGLVELVRRSRNADENGAGEGLDAQQMAILDRLIILRREFANWTDDNLEEMIQSTVWPDLANRLEETFAESLATIETDLGSAEIQRNRYEHDLQQWKERTVSLEHDYRASLESALRVQWNLGPRFLMAVEKAFSELGAKSVPWDPARMVGWKLKVAVPNITAEGLVAATRSLNENLEIRAAQTTEFNGSLFADYVHYAAVMESPKLSTRAATQGLLCNLLSMDGLLQLNNDAVENHETGMPTNSSLSSSLLERWGWPKDDKPLPKPITRYLEIGEDGDIRLSAISMNDIRSSVESLLKDLVGVTLTTLNWNDKDLDEEMAIHCPDYNKRPGHSWRVELNGLGVGGAAILLKSLLPLGFPGSVSEQGAKEFHRKCAEIGTVLNNGSHDPPPRPPTEQQYKEYGSNIKELLDTVEGIVGELPWHLSPAQTFGHEPMIVTGQAWSHSHPEERMLRVMLWAGDKNSEELKVWNKSRSNPIITDGVLL